VTSTVPRPTPPRYASAASTKSHAVQAARAPRFTIGSFRCYGAPGLKRESGDVGAYRRPDAQATRERGRLSERPVIAPATATGRAGADAHLAQRLLAPVDQLNAECHLRGY